MEVEAIEIAKRAQSKLHFSFLPSINTDVYNSKENNTESADAITRAKALVEAEKAKEQSSDSKTEETSNGVAAAAAAVTTTGGQKRAREEDDVEAKADGEREAKKVDVKE